MNSKIIAIGVIVAIAIALIWPVAYSEITSQKLEKVGVVSVEEVISKYKGLQGASKKIEEEKNLYTQRMAVLEASVDSLSRLNPVDSNTIQKQIIQHRALQQESENKLSALHEKLVSGAYNQINSFIKEFAEEKGYSFILGSTASGSIMYSKEHYDVTLDVIKYINAK